MSLKTDNFNLFKYEDNDIGDFRFLHDSMDIIDKGINPFYVATLDSTNVYKVTTGLNKTSLANGYSIKVAIPSNSNGTVSIIIDSCSAVPVKKPNNNSVKNFKQNGVYSLTYYNGNFILASGGVDDVNFSASDLLTGKSANNSDGEKVNGTMPNIGQQTATINAGGKTMIKKGFHDGTGYIQSNSMSKQLTDLGATLLSANQLINGVKAVDKNGNLITGTATIESLGGKEYKEGSLPAINHPSYSNSRYMSINLSNIGFIPRIVAGNKYITTNGVTYSIGWFICINLDGSIVSFYNDGTNDVIYGNKTTDMRYPFFEDNRGGITVKYFAWA